MSKANNTTYKLYSNKCEPADIIGTKYAKNKEHIYTTRKTAVRPTTAINS
jgi:hypothetical protein